MSSQRKTRDTVGVYNHTHNYIMHVTIAEAKDWINRELVIPTYKRGQLTAVTQVEPPPPPSEAKESPCSISARHVRINAGVEDVSIQCERYVRARVEGFARASWADRIVYN